MPEILKERVVLDPDVSWQSSFKDLGVGAKFIGFWDKTRAYGFGIAPVIFIDVYPVNPGDQLDEDFKKKLVDKIVDEIIDKVFASNKEGAAGTVLYFGDYDPDKTVLSLVLTEVDSDWGPYASKNDLPL